MRNSDRGMPRFLRPCRPRPSSEGRVEDHRRAGYNHRHYFRKEMETRSYSVRVPNPNVAATTNAVHSSTPSFHTPNTEQPRVHRNSCKRRTLITHAIDLEQRPS